LRKVFPGRNTGSNAVTISECARAPEIDQSGSEIHSLPILFFGDSLIEGWDATIWERSLASRGALNAGVSGDRTDHLLWRLHHGNLAGPQPKAVVLLIGTNDLAYGRSPELTADGIRANLEMLRQRLPEARILLLGLLPREESPSAPLRLEVAQVNRLIRDCADGEHIFYAEIGQVLLDRDGLLPAAISPDQLHFTALGYALLAARLEPELDRLPGPSRWRMRALVFRIALVPAATWASATAVAALAIPGRL